MRMFCGLLTVALLVTSPITYGQEEDGRTIKLSPGQVSALGSNCNKKKNELREGFDVVKFGICTHPTPVDADAYAFGTLLPQVLADGGVLDVEFGHRTVKNSAGPIPLPNTYLSYARGNQLREGKATPYRKPPTFGNEVENANDVEEVSAIGVAKEVKDVAALAGLNYLGAVEKRIDFEEPNGRDFARKNDQVTVPAGTQRVYVLVRSTDIGFGNLSTLNERPLGRVYTNAAFRGLSGNLCTFRVTALCRDSNGDDPWWARVYVVVFCYGQ